MIGWNNRCDLFPSSFFILSLRQKEMWRSSMFLSRTLLAARYGQKLLPQLIAAPVHNFRPPSLLFSTQQQETNHRNSTNSIIINDEEDDKMSYTEAKKLLRLVNLEALKRNLGMEEKEVIDYMELLKVCETMGITRSSDEAIKFSHILDEAGVVLLFRNKVYLHPHKVADLVSKVVPLNLTAESDPRKEELKELLKKKEEIDMLAHRYVRRVLWAGLGFLLVQLSLFFRLTFWEFSWDVMEPITFFTTMTGLIIGYTYFLVTSRDPTYQDMMKRLFLSRQRKLIKKCNFDLDRFLELQKLYKCPPDTIERMGLS